MRSFLTLLAVLGAVVFVLFACSKHPNTNAGANGGTSPSHTPNTRHRHAAPAYVAACKSVAAPTAPREFTVCHAKYPHLWIKGKDGKVHQMVIQGDGARKAFSACKAPGTNALTCGQQR